MKVGYDNNSDDALGRRIKKVVTNSGDHDGTVVYYYKGHQIIETGDGSIPPGSGCSIPPR
ncbi:MAG: hypothetical protein KAV82_10215 [Phycisphaerae bacterium]|nr:hypothetical protein [Phycisphaerae bacterium]